MEGMTEFQRKVYEQDRRERDQIMRRMERGVKATIEITVDVDALAERHKGCIGTAAELGRIAEKLEELRRVLEGQETGYWGEEIGPEDPQ